MNAEPGDDIKKHFFPCLLGERIEKKTNTGLKKPCGIFLLPQGFFVLTYHTIGHTLSGEYTTFYILCYVKNMTTQKMDKITLRISEEEKEEFREICEKNGAKMSSVLKLYVKDYVNKNKIG